MADCHRALPSAGPSGIGPETVDPVGTARLPMSGRTIGACSVYPVGVGIDGSGPPLPKFFNYFRSTKSTSAHCDRSCIAAGSTLGDGAYTNGAGTRRLAPAGMPRLSGRNPALRTPAGARSRRLEKALLVGGRAPGPLPAPSEQTSSSNRQPCVFRKFASSTSQRRF